MFQYSGKTDVLQGKDPLPPLLFQARETETICWQNNGLQVIHQWCRNTKHISVIIPSMLICSFLFFCSIKLASSQQCSMGKGSSVVCFTPLSLHYGILISELFINYLNEIKLIEVYACTSFFHIKMHPDFYTLISLYISSISLWVHAQ